MAARSTFLLLGLALLGVLCTGSASTAGTPPAPDPGARVVYSPPVDAPVSQPFDAPETPYGPGNRGIDYAVTPGTPVRAAADGTVTFAGQVAGDLYVTVRHTDGIRTSYSYLAQITVAAGQQVARGQVLGVTTDRFQVGARIGDTYIDPAELWAGPLRVFLVPLAG
jgi:murein DD-endopeptidase MepM/ murein hydrolase activator NlpD